MDKQTYVILRVPPKTQIQMNLDKVASLIRESNLLALNEKASLSDAEFDGSFDLIKAALQDAGYEINKK